MLPARLTTSGRWKIRWCSSNGRPTLWELTCASTPWGPKGFLASPQKIARVVVRCAENPRPEVVVGTSVRTLRLAHALAPGIVERVVAQTLERGFLRQEPEQPSPGNLYEASSEWVAPDGGFNREAGRLVALKRDAPPPSGRPCSVPEY